MSNSFLLPDITLELEIALLSLILLVGIVIVIMPMVIIRRKKRTRRRRSLNASFRYVEAVLASSSHHAHHRSRHLPVCDGMPRSRQLITYLHVPSPRPVHHSYVNTAYKHADEFLNHLSKI